MGHKLKKKIVMKKVSIIAIMVITIVSSAFAGDNNALDFKGADHFKKTFPNATKVVYEVKKDFTKVTFTWNNLNLQSFFDRQGNLIGTSREIEVNALPLAYVMNINREYNGYNILEVIEFDHAEIPRGIDSSISISGRPSTDSFVSCFRSCPEWSSCVRRAR